MKKHTDSDRLIGAAVKNLVDHGWSGAAQALLPCHMETIEIDEYNVEYEYFTVRTALRCPVQSYERIVNSDRKLSDLGYQIQAALCETFPIQINFAHLFLVPLPKIDVALPASSPARVTNNDGIHIWQALRFASISERRIAQALDDAGVMFLPSSKARLNGPDGRENRIPDFLICKDGKWGILEVDGEPFHPPSRTVHDHARDELFHLHGIRVVRHYDANECYNTPKAVVANFLSLLDKHYP